MQHITIFRDSKRYAGWPANYGIWHWGNEIVVGYTLGFPDLKGKFHARDTSRPFVNVQSRSLDGGKTWVMNDFPGKTPGNRGLSADEHMNNGMGVGDVIDSDPPAEPPGDIDFTHPDFALMCARTGLKAGTRSFFYVSYDRCQSWLGPYALPMFGLDGIQARTDYIVEAQNKCLFLMTANKPNGREGYICCIRTSDGGKTFSLVSRVSDEPQHNEDFAIMPATIRLDENRLLTAIRCRSGKRQERQDRNWIDMYLSHDDAASWQKLNRPVMFDDRGHNGNPPTLNQLPDGRIVLVYGNRDAPFTIAARLSDDEGQSWGAEIILRDGGGNYDIGYPRTIVQDDGIIVTVYYFNANDKEERFIEAVIWKP